MGEWEEGTEYKGEEISLTLWSEPIVHISLECELCFETRPKP